MAGQSRQQSALKLLGFSILTAAYFLLNPFWYGDGPYYALHIENGWNSLPLDAGHFLWHPLGWLAWTLLKIPFQSIEALTALRLLSSITTAAACFFTYRVAYLLSGSPRTSMMAATLVGVSNMALSYGGSGCSYTTAMALGALALIPIAPTSDREWGWLQGLAASAAAAAACVFWGMSVLLLPGISLTAAFSSHGSVARRVLRGLLVGALSVAGVVLITGITYALTASRLDVSDYLAWARGSNHGKELQITWLNAARALYGFHTALVNLGSLGPTLKAVLLGARPSASSLPELVALPVALGLGTIFVGSLFLLVRTPREKITGAVALAIIAPVALFAAGWKGADVERYSLAIPMIATVIAHGLDASLRMRSGRLRLAWTFVGLVAAVNLATLVIPALVTRDRGGQMALGRIAREHMPAHSALIIAGHGLTGDAAARYFYDIKVFNVTYDAVHRGSEGFGDRIRQVADSAIARGGSIAVLSDLVGHPTPGGIGFIEPEHPGLDLADLQALFAPWQWGSSWRVDRYTFVEVTPPDPGTSPGAANR